jgi:hypothetical protein
MTPTTLSNQPKTLDEVKRLFDNWRSTRKKRSRIPVELWHATASLADQYPVHRIARTLRLNHSTLRDLVAQNAPAPTVQTSFLELPALQPVQVFSSLIEMENRHGETIRMHLAGATSLDLVTLSQNFWAR